MFPQPGAAPSPPSPIVIRMEPFKLAGQRMRIPVQVQVGNEVRQLVPGDNPLPLPPGVWPVRVWCSYYGIRVGRAEATADTRAGHPVLLHYTAPMTIYSRGVLADRPVPRPGKGVLVGIYAAAFAVVMLGVAVAAVAG